MATAVDFTQGAGPQGLPLGAPGIVTTGRVLFVSSATGNNSAWNGKQGASPQFPFATIQYAMTQCRDSKGDVIYVMPGHAETIAASATLALSKIGVQVIGLGNRRNRPTITLNGTDSTIAISAASVTLRNVILLAGIDEIVSAITVTAAFVTLDAVDVVEVTSKQFIQFLLTTTAADDIIVINCTHHQSTAPAANSLWISLIATDRAKIVNNRIFITTTNSASSSVISVGTASVNILIQNNVIVQLGGTATIPINCVTNTSGFITGNTVASAKTAIAGSIACASCYAALNYAGHVVNTSGILEPGTDT